MKTVTVGIGTGREFQLDMQDGQLLEVRYRGLFEDPEVVPVVMDGGDWVGETLTVPTWLVVALIERDFTEEGDDE